MRRARAGAVVGMLLAAWLLAGCTIDTSSVCAIPPCGAPSSGPGYSLVGFPPGRVDRTVLHTGGFHGVLHVGDVATLYLVHGSYPDTGPLDTIRSVTWALDDSTAARISGDATGAGVISARVPGPVGHVRANGGYYKLVSCTPTRSCETISGIDVLP